MGGSIGVKGARVTSSSRGPIYVTAGSHGFYYRQSLDRPEKIADTRPNPQKTTHVRDTPIVDAGECVDIPSADLLALLNERARLTNFAPLAYGASIFLVALAVLSSAASWALAAIAVLLVGVYVHRVYTRKSTTSFIYSMNEAETANFNLVRQAVEHLSQSVRVWQVMSKIDTTDFKRNAGASTLLRRTTVRVSTSTIPRVETNITVFALQMSNSKLYLLPDMMLFWQAGSFTAIGYDQLNAVAGSLRFVEHGDVPSDATIVDRTRRFVNKNGRPDRRFKGNRHIPIAVYGTIKLSSASGLYVLLHSSSVEKARAFVDCLLERVNRQHGSETQSQSPTARARALSSLGIYHVATEAEIKTAYFRCRQIVEDLSESPDLARQKKAEIDAAYRFLMKAPPPEDAKPDDKIPPPRSERPEARAKALQTLGLRAESTREEITEAYYRAAQMNHPDKVAGLAPEFKELAHRRMRDINEAYKILKG